MIPRRPGGKRPRRRPWQELRARRRQSAFLLPSLLTTGNLFCGFFAMLLTVDGRYTEATLAIFVAMIMDMLDGRVARLMKATSQFGVEYDSLADVISFGVAPAFLLYSFALRDLGRPAWFAAFLFVICGALRLARFNVITGATDKRYFIGLPIPAGAAVACSLVILLHGEELTRWMRVSVAVVTYLTSLLMVSTFRYWSFKEFDWAKRPPVQTLLIVVLAGMIVATKHEVLLFLVFGGYAASGPVRRLIVGHTPVAVPADVPSKDHP
jgi:CDP-diacylglycerol---serine O-phosphatidyltransferase